MKTSRANANSSRLAVCVAPEDLERGDFVGVLNIVHEFPSFLWCCDASSLPYDEPVRISFCESNSGTPLKIKAICLPFVFVKTPHGKSRSMDVRKVQLVRLNTRYASQVWKELKSSGK